MCPIPVGAKKKPVATAVPSEKEIEASAIPKTHGNKNRIVLGLDISSSCIGWGLACDGELPAGRRHLPPITYGKYIFKTTAKIGEKLVAFEGFLNTLLDTYAPVVLAYEKPLSARNINNARSIELVGILKKVWREWSGTEIKKAWILTPKTIKNRLKVKRGRNHDRNKEIMVNKINHLFGLNLKYHPNSKYESDDDVADAIAVVVAYLRLEIPEDE